MMNSYETSRQWARVSLLKKTLGTYLMALPRFFYQLFLKFDRKLDGALVFFFKHYGKTKFMVAMSKKAQSLGLERLFLKGPKAFVYFFLFYLVRDTILYILLPILFAKVTM